MQRLSDDVGVLGRFFFQIVEPGNAAKFGALMGCTERNLGVRIVAPMLAHTGKETLALASVQSVDCLAGARHESVAMLARARHIRAEAPTPIPKRRLLQRIAFPEISG